MESVTGVAIISILCALITKASYKALADQLIGKFFNTSYIYPHKPQWYYRLCVVLPTDKMAFFIT